MKFGLKPIAWVSLFLLQACTSPEAPKVKPVPIKEKVSHETIVPQTFIMRGKLVLDNRLQAFTPCDSNKQFVAKFHQQDLKQARTVTKNSNLPLYAELIGHLEAPDATGLEADFTARFQVASISIITPHANSSCKQRAHPTKAFGNHPPWAVSFNKNKLNYSNPAKQLSQNLPIKSTRISQNQRNYQLDNGELLLSRGACQQPKDENLYGWQAVLTLEKQSQLGCATLANMDTTLAWSGLYHAFSTKSRGFSVQMQLNSDHSATTIYHNQDGKETNWETGFWQQIDRKKIQVVMTKHQDQRLITERIFSGDKYQITSKTEIVNGTPYTIADGGLTLYRAKAGYTQNQSVFSERDLSALKVNSSAKYDAKVAEALRKYFILHRTPVSQAKYRWLKFDLNNDGKEELLTLMDWCTKQGCTMLVFESHNENWRFNSRINNITTPFFLGTKQRGGWQELIIQQGKVTKALEYTGVSYPGNFNAAEQVPQQRISKVVLFNDGLQPTTSGVKL